MSAAGESGRRAPGAFVPPSFTSGKISYGEQSSLEAAMAACGVPVVAAAFSGIHVIAVRSYLYPGAFFNASFVVFITGYHLLLSLVLNWTALKGTATSFSPTPRNPPTPTISTAILPL